MSRHLGAMIFAVILVTGVMNGALTIGRSGLAAQSTEGTQPVNVELILDVSGSMAQLLPTGETRMEAAKAVLTDLVNGIPQNGDINVGLRIYGHEGDNTVAGQAASCQSSELVVQIDGVDKDAIIAEIGDLQPTGWTPLALSLQAAEEDFPIGNDVTNAIVLVTDGLETCGGDPCLAAGGANAGDAGIVTHVVGFALTPEEQALLGCISESGQGLLLGAGNADELSDALFTVFVEELDIPVTPAPRQTIPLSFAEGTYEIGETFEIEGGEFEVTVTGFTEAESMNFGYSSENARGKFVAVELVVSNPGRASAVLDYQQFRLYTVSTDRITGLETDATIPAQIGLYDVALFDELQPGLEYYTVVIFDVGVESEGYWLVVGGNGDIPDQGVRLSGNSVPRSSEDDQESTPEVTRIKTSEKLRTPNDAKSASNVIETGETFEIDGGEFEVTVTGFTEAESMNFGYTSENARGKFVAVELVVSNPGRTSAVLDYEEFRLYTESTDRITGLETDATIPAQIGLYDVALFDELQPGLEYSTVVIFDVAIESEGYWLLVGGNSDNADYGVRLSGNSVPDLLDE